MSSPYVKLATVLVKLALEGPYCLSDWRCLMSSSRRHVGEAKRSVSWWTTFRVCRPYSDSINAPSIEKSGDKRWLGSFGVHSCVFFPPIHRPNFFCWSRSLMVLAARWEHVVCAACAWKMVCDFCAACENAHIIFFDSLIDQWTLFQLVPASR